MFERPTSATQFVKNLKFAADRDLFAQPAFFNDRVLLKFFDGERITWTGSTAMITPKKNATVQLLVSVERVSRAIEAHNAAASPHTYVARHTLRSVHIDIEIESASYFTVGLVREIFGRDSKEDLDSGTGSDGHTYTPVVKGRLAYSRNRKREGLESFVELSTNFVIRTDAPPALRVSPVNGPRTPDAFAPTDVVQRVIIDESEQ
jgi:hypothetical protein